MLQINFFMAYVYFGWVIPSLDFNTASCLALAGVSMVGTIIFSSGIYIYRKNKS